MVEMTTTDKVNLAHWDFQFEDAIDNDKIKRCIEESITNVLNSDPPNISMDCYDITVSIPLGSNDPLYFKSSLNDLVCEEMNLERVSGGAFGNYENSSIKAVRDEMKRLVDMIDATPR